MRIVMPAVAVVAGIAIIAAACSGDEDDGVRLAEFQTTLEQNQHDIVVAQLVAALDALDGAGIHEFNEQATQARSLDDVPAVAYRADVRKIGRIVGAVAWPEEVQDEAQELLQLVDPMQAALDGDDLGAIKEVSPQFHNAWHKIRSVGYQALSGEAISEEEQHGQATEGGTEHGR